MIGYLNEAELQNKQFRPRESKQRRKVFSVINAPIIQQQQQIIEQNETSLDFMKPNIRNKRAQSQLEKYQKLEKTQNLNLSVNENKQTLNDYDRGISYCNIGQIKLNNLNFPLLDQIKLSTKSYANRRKKINFLQEAYTPVSQSVQKYKETDEFFLKRLDHEALKSVQNQKGMQESKFLFKNDFLIQNKFKNYLKSSKLSTTLDIQELKIDQNILKEINKSMEIQNKKTSLIQNEKIFKSKEQTYQEIQNVIKEQISQEQNNKKKPQEIQIFSQNFLSPTNICLTEQSSNLKSQKGLNDDKTEEFQLRPTGHNYQRRIKNLINLGNKKNLFSDSKKIKTDCSYSTIDLNQYLDSSSNLLNSRKNNDSFCLKEQQNQELYGYTSQSVDNQIEQTNYFQNRINPKIEFEKNKIKLKNKKFLQKNNSNLDSTDCFNNSSNDNLENMKLKLELRKNEIRELKKEIEQNTCILQNNQKNQIEIKQLKEENNFLERQNEKIKFYLENNLTEIKRKNEKRKWLDNLIIYLSDINTLVKNMKNKQQNLVQEIVDIQNYYINYFQLLEQENQQLKVAKEKIQETITQKTKEIIYLMNMLKSAAQVCKINDHHVPFSIQNSPERILKWEELKFEKEIENKFKIKLQQLE